MNADPMQGRAVYECVTRLIATRQSWGTAMEKWFDVFLKIVAHSMRLETQTHTWNTRGPGLLTEARGYRMYMHSASQFGSLGPGSPGPGSTQYSVPAYSCD